MDCFSRLPDEILIHILSFLTANEAAVTSALSTRWEDLWKLTGRIRISFPTADLDSEEDQYERLDRVDSILYSFRDPISFPIHEICISDGYSNSDVAPDVEVWIRFALDRQDVSTLNFRLLAWKLYSRYRFPPPRCRGPRNYKLMHLDLTSFRICPRFRGFRNLRSVSLDSCKVADAAFASINRQCIKLESLKLLEVYELENLWISSALCNLNHLEIDCRRLKSLLIDSPNLEFLKYEGASPAVCHRIRAPMLKEVSLRCDPKKGPSPLSLLRCDSGSIIGEVEKLSLELELEIEQHFDLSRPCLLNHVKELSVMVASSELTGLDDLLRASLSLESFNLSFQWFYEDWLGLPLAGLKHQNLQKIRIGRFLYTPDHLQLLRYLAETVVRLEEMEITVWCDPDNDATSIREYIKEDIEDKLPLGAKLAILPYR